MTSTPLRFHRRWLPNRYRGELEGIPTWSYLEGNKSLKRLRLNLRDMNWSQIMACPHLKLIMGDEETYLDECFFDFHSAPFQVLKDILEGWKLSIYKLPKVLAIHIEEGDRLEHEIQKVVEYLTGLVGEKGLRCLVLHLAPSGDFGLTFPSFFDVSFESVEMFAGNRREASYIGVKTFGGEKERGVYGKGWVFHEKWKRWEVDVRTLLQRQVLAGYRRIRFFVSLYTRRN